MVNYQTGKIYKLVSYQTDKCYIGSTCNPLYKRFFQHKHNCKLYKESKYSYVSSFELIDYDDCEIVLIENYPCNDKNELHKRERYHIENTEHCVNKVIPTRTNKEYKKNTMK